MKTLKKTFITMYLFIAAISLAALTFFGCKTEIDTSDKTPPSEVSNLSAENLDGAVLLSWTDPSDEDLFGIEITYTGDENSQIRAVSAMQEKSVFVAPKTQSAEITNLKNGTEYTFTLKAMDTSGNKSIGKSISFSPNIIEKSALEIRLSLSQENPTNQDVAININVTTPAEKIKTVKYASGKQEKSYFTKNDSTNSGSSGEQNNSENQNSSGASNGTELTADKDGKYSFSTDRNGTFTVFVLDSDGRQETENISIRNIDRTVPNKVLNLGAFYDYGKREISVTWKTGDADIDHYVLSYSVAATHNETNLTEAKYVLSEIEPESGKYEFTVKAVDKAGNAGESVSTSITPSEKPLVASISLSRNRIAYNASDTAIKATVQGSLFSLIESQDDKTLKVQVTDEEGNVQSTTNAEINAETNTATATIDVPKLSAPEATIEGKNYKVRAVICGSTDYEHTATLNVASPSDVESITLETTVISVDEVTKGMTTKATVKGTNFDAAEKITLRLYTSKTEVYGEDTEIDSGRLEKDGNNFSFSADIKVPALDDKYTLKILFDGKMHNESAALQVYGKPEFTSFTIPYAGTSAQGRFVTATVAGKNFTAPGITENSFAVSCAGNTSIAEDAKVRVANDSRLKISLKIPGTAGDYTVKITNSSTFIEGTLTVKDHSAHKVGQIILSDGTFVDTLDSSQSQKPVAIFAGLNDNGAAIGLGLYSKEKLMFSPQDSTGYNLEFENIVCTPSEYGNGAAKTATFTGDTDGSDNWDEICSADPFGVQNAEENYPAYNFVNSYGKTYADKLGTFTDGWYMPSLKELCIISNNVEKIYEGGYENNEIEGINLYLEMTAWSSSAVSKGEWNQGEGKMHSVCVKNYSFPYITGEIDRSYKHTSHFATYAVRAF